MEVIFLLIGFSLLVALIFLYLFFWAVKDGQYDDAYTPSMRILFDNKDQKKEETKTNNTNKRND
jgi:cbb3-type cytochrome oxidase maturation protein